jgi:uncharacterized membrane protein YwaF
MPLSLDGRSYFAVDFVSAIKEQQWQIMSRSESVRQVSNVTVCAIIIFDSVIKLITKYFCLSKKIKGVKKYFLVS